MSYEGRVQAICEKGHRYDGHEPYGYPFITCPICNSPAAWTNDVDDTNCQALGFIPNKEFDKFIDVPAVKKVCDLGHEHIITHATYRIPSDEETKKMRHWQPRYGGTPLVPIIGDK